MMHNFITFYALCRVKKNVIQRLKMICFSHQKRFMMVKMHYFLWRYDLC